MSGVHCLRSGVASDSSENRYKCIKKAWWMAVMHGVKRKWTADLVSRMEKPRIPDDQIASCERHVRRLRPGADHVLHFVQ